MLVSCAVYFPEASSELTTLSTHTRLRTDGINARNFVCVTPAVLHCLSERHGLANAHSRVY